MSFPSRFLHWSPVLPCTWACCWLPGRCPTPRLTPAQAAPGTAGGSAAGMTWPQGRLEREVSPLGCRKLDRAGMGRAKVADRGRVCAFPIGQDQGTARRRGEQGQGGGHSL